MINEKGKIENVKEVAFKVTDFTFFARRSFNRGGFNFIFITSFAL
jgi:hypothetical protein